MHFILPLATFYLWVQAVFPHIERRFYWGEVFAVLLLPSIMNVRYLHPGQGRIAKAVFFMLFFIPIFSILYTLIFWSQEYDTYFLLRHLAMFHYIIYFFAAYNYADGFLGIMGKFFWLPFILLIPGLGFLTVNNFNPSLQIDAISGSVLFAWAYVGFLKRCYSIRGALIGFATFVASLGLLSQATNRVEMVVMLLLLPLIRLLKYWRMLVPLPARKIAVRIGFMVIIVSLGSLLFLLGGEIRENIFHQIGIGQIPGQLGLDLGELGQGKSFYSLLWRVSFWAYLINRFFAYPLGIGLGTPIIEEELERVMALGVTETASLEYQSYALGAHNSFVTLLVRFGIIFLIPLVVCSVAVFRMLSQYWKLCRYSPLKMPDSWVVFGSVIAFFVVVIEAMFNVVIETPIYAVLFWFSFGLMGRLVGDYVATHQELLDPVSISVQGTRS